LAEALAAVLAVAWLLLPLTAGQALWGLAFSLVLLTLALADLWAALVPDLLVLPALGLALMAAFLAGEGLEALAGAALVGGGLWVVSWVFLLVSGRAGLGLGDVKLGALLGALLGWQLGGQVVALAAVLGLAWGLARGRHRWGQPLAFAPCLALAGVAGLLARALEQGPWLP
jgi:leader peptidase (prepilin peptidase)/N-methyltransferase